tara:strand:- start:81 stop:509 length:429 start_codon:yes stop_codon:yes gene_type:complete
MNDIKLYSQIDPKRLLHQVWRRVSNPSQERVDLVDPDQFIQCSALHMKKGRTFKPHRHIWKMKALSFHIAQESWFVVSGRVNATFYDIDDTILTEIILSAGDVSFTFDAGHNYEILEDDTYVMEYKTGPYQGQKKDKRFIGD